jgi:hypothetical protein
VTAVLALTLLLAACPSPTASPGAQDSAPEAPVFSLSPGTYAAAVSVAITGEPDAAILFTDNGGDPRRFGREYAEPLTINWGRKELKAVAMIEKDGEELYSDVVAGSYAVDLSARIGSAHVNGAYWPAGFAESFLEAGAKAILDTGMRAVKLYLHKPDTYYSFDSWPSFSSMVEIASHERYEAVIDMDFDVIALTSYSFVHSDEHYFRSGISTAEAEAEETAFYNLASHLLSTYSGTGKIFILQNWEGDWAARGSYDPEDDPSDSTLTAMITWLNARQSGVTRARAETPHDNVWVYHAAEVNRVLSAANGGSEKTLVDEVLPSLAMDLYSYSAYDSTVPAAVYANAAPFRKALAYLKDKAPDSATLAPDGTPFGENNIYVGEFGFQEVGPVSDDGSFTPNRPDVYNASAVRTYLRTVLTEALGHGVQYFFYWQAFDNEVQPDAPSPATANTHVQGFWLVKPDGSSSAARRFFRDEVLSLE